MAIYGKKYTLEFDDVIEGEFNDYRLEIFKKYSDLTTANNVYVSVYNSGNEAISENDPVRVIGGVVVRSKASDSSTMPSTGIAVMDIPISQGRSNAVLVSGVLEHSYTSSFPTFFYVGENGGAIQITSGLTIIQQIGVQVNYNVFVLTDKEVTLKGTGTPIKLTYNLTDNDILSPFRSSYLDISFYKESLSDDFSELFAAESDDFKVYLYKNDSLFWQGWIGAQLFSEPFASPPYPITLKAYDGLNLLKDTPYFDDVEVFQATSNLFNDRYGYHNIVDVVEKCIYNTGVLNDVFYCINVSNSESTSFTNTPHLFPTRARVHHQTFLKGESNSMNMEEVLGMVLRSLGATIYQRDGDWCVIKISDFTLSPVPILLKRSNWIVGSTTETNYITTTQTITNSEEVSKNINLFQIDGDSTMTLQYPLKEVTIEQEFDHNMVTSTTIDSVRDLGADEPTGTLLFTEWEVDGSNIEEAVVLRKNETQGQPRQLPKSFIEADLSTTSLLVDYCDPSLSYPVSHECTIDSSKITGVKAFAKARPLGRSLISKEALSVMFSPKLSYTSGGVLSETGFGRSYYYESSMINKKILRINREAFGPPTLNRMAQAQLTVLLLPNGTNTQQFTINIKENGIQWWTSGLVTFSAFPSYPNQQELNTYVFGGGWEGGSIFGLYPYSPNYDPQLGNFDLIEADYEVEFISNSGNSFPTRFEWFLRGNTTTSIQDPKFEISWVSVSESSPLEATTDNFKFAIKNRNPYVAPTVFRDGGNFGTTKPNTDSNDTTASTFRKSFDCIGDDWLATFIQSNRINDWTEFSITGTENWQNNISNLKVNMNIFGSAKIINTDASAISSPFTDNYDVSFTDIKLLPLISNYTFSPKKQEYILTQSGNFSSKFNKKVKIGSGLFNTGSNRYITFDSTSGSIAKKSWDTFRDRRGLVGIGIENATIQHLVGACYMELYRVSVRRLDGTHYGNYKYGDKLQPIVGGSIETLNGSQGRFFPMNVVMDLRMARTSFSGDDLMDNTGTTWQPTLTKSIKWIGDNGITETETLS